MIFCEDLADSLGPAGGIALHDHDLYIDIGGSRWSKLYTRTVIHHEFFHILDFAMHDESASAMVCRTKSGKDSIRRNSNTAVSHLALRMILLIYPEGFLE